MTGEPRVPSCKHRGSMVQGSRMNSWPLRAGVVLRWSGMLVVWLSAIAAAVCPGDCSGDGVVTVDELILAVNITLGDAPLAACPSADADRDGSVTVDDILHGVNALL